MSGELHIVRVVGADEGASGALASVLRALDLDVRSASDSTQLLAGEVVSMVIVYGHPADRTAIDLARELRARRGGSCPRIIWIPSAEPRRVERTHFDDVVNRPYRATDLLARVRRLLRASGTMQVVRDLHGQRRLG